MRFRKLRRISLIFLLSIIGLLALIFATLNLPFSQRFATRKVNQMLRASEVPVHLREIGRILPNSLVVKGVLIEGVAEDTLLYAEKIQANVRLWALIRNQVVLEQLNLQGASVYLAMDQESLQYNIAEAFQAGSAGSGKEKNPTGKAWSISIRDGILSSFHFQMDDSVSGMHILQDIDEIGLKDLFLPLAEQEIRAHTLVLKNARGYVKLSSGEPAPEHEPGKPWRISLLNLSLENIDFAFDQDQGSKAVHLFLGEGEIKARKMDLPGKVLDVRSISISDTHASVLSSPETGESASSSVSGPDPFPWFIQINDIDLDKIDIRVEQTGNEDQGRNEGQGGKGSALHLAELDLELKDFLFERDRAGLKLRRFNFQMDNGFALRNMRGELDSDGESTRMNLALETQLSRIELEGRANQGVLNMASAPREIQNAFLEFRRSSISLKDFLPFMQEWQNNPAIAQLANRPLSVSGELGMRNAVFTLTHFSLSQDRNFLLSLEGQVDDPFLFSKTRGELGISVSGVDTSWMRNMMLSMGMGADLPLRQGLNLEGTVSKSLSSSEFDLRLGSDLGNVSGAGSVEFDTDSFAVQASFEQVLLGEFLDLEDLGAFSGSADISGSGFARENLQTTVNLLVDSLWFRDHKYTQTRVQARLGGKEFQVHMVADDPSFSGDLRTSLMLGDSAFQLKASGTLAAQLNALHLTQDTLYVKTQLEGQIIRRDHALTSEIVASDILLVNDFQNAEIEQVRASLVTDSLQTVLGASGDFFQLQVQVGKQLSELNSLGADYKAYLATFTDSAQVYASTRVHVLPEINARGRIFHHEALGMLLKDTGFHANQLDFSMEHYGTENGINYGIQGRGIAYKMVTLDSLEALVIDSAGMLHARVELGQVSLFSGPRNDWLISGSFTPWRGMTSLSVRDPRGQRVYDIEMAAIIRDQELFLEVPSRSILMNRVQWQLDNPGLLTLDLSTQSLSPSLNMFTASSYLRISELLEEGVRSYQLEMSQVEMESLVRKDLFPGRPDASISGTLALKMPEDSKRTLESNLHLGQVHYSDLYFEDLHLKGSMDYGDSSDFSVDFNLSLDSAGLQLAGRGTESGELQIRAEFSSIPLNILEPFTRQTLSDLRGNISGYFDVSNIQGNDRVDGRMSFREVQLRIDPLNSTFLIPDQGLLVADERLLFDQFRVLDTLRNELLVDGFLDFGAVPQVHTDLHISSSKLQVMSRGPVDESTPFYGEVFVDSEFSVKGPVSNPSIRGNIRLARGTEVFYRHMEDLSMSESQKILNFTGDSLQDIPMETQGISRQGALIQSSVETMVEIDPSTLIHVNLSRKIYGLDLQVKGGGRLNYNQLPNSQMSLAGSYEVGQGSAQLKLVGWPTKSFTISEGGYIRWDGRVEDPELNFQALNRVSSSYLNPVDGKQRPVDFDVGLQLTDHLSDLDVMFTVSTSDPYLMSIINTLSPEEQMRQAISILLFESIDLPGISSSGSYMSQQVNKMLTSQLNQLTQSAIKGVDISFGIDTYATPQGGDGETNTSLSYEVRKSLMNDRATIEVSGRLRDINQPGGMSNTALNNISLEYNLDSAATKFLKIYNEHTYEDVFEGEVIKTGIGFSIRKKYRYFRDIWKREEKRKKEKPQKGGEE